MNEQIADAAIGALFCARWPDIRPLSVLVLGDIGGCLALCFVEEAGNDKLVLIHQHIADAVVQCLDGTVDHFPALSVPAVQVVYRKGRCSIRQHTASIKGILVYGNAGEAITSLIRSNNGRRVQPWVIGPVQSVPARHFVFFLKGRVVGGIEQVHILAFLPACFGCSAETLGQRFRYLRFQGQQCSCKCYNQPVLHLPHQITPFFLNTGHSLVNTVLKVEQKAGLLRCAPQGRALDIAVVQGSFPAERTAQPDIACQ